MATLFAFLLATQLSQLGQMGQLDQPPVKARQYVIYAAEAQTIPANKRGTLELRFHVTDGFHVNSHTPKSELQIPTALTLLPTAQIKLSVAEYPAGKIFTFAFDPTEKLDVYTGDFTIKVPVTASVGAHQIQGTLQYQACDRAACFPPKTLPVTILFTAK